MLRAASRITVVLSALLLVQACSEPVTPLKDTPSTVRNSAVQFWDVSSSVRWNRKAIRLFRARNGDFGRINAYTTLAAYRAALAAQGSRGKDAHPSIAGAVAGASAVVLEHFFPLDVANIEAEIAAQRAEPKWPGEENLDFGAGEAIGRSIAAAVLVSSLTDNYGVESPGTPPVGAGRWVSSGAPIISAPYHARPFFLLTTDELVLPPPPVFGSAEYLAALAATRAMSDNRTAAQLAITQKWIPFSSTLFDSVTAELVVKYHKPEVDAARIFAYANLAAYDAIIACFNNKFRYWYIRPSQADPLITTPLGLPNHPSYPSAHSCQSGAWMQVLGDAFPPERDMLNAMGDEAALSRELGGLHYHFDNIQGQALGRMAGKLALERGGIE